MIERFQGANRPALVAAVLLQRFVQSRNEIAEDLIAAGELLEFSTNKVLIVQNDGKMHCALEGRFYATSTGFAFELVEQPARISFAGR